MVGSSDKLSHRRVAFLSSVVQIEEELGCKFEIYESGLKYYDPIVDKDYSLGYAYKISNLNSKKEYYLRAKEGKEKLKAVRKKIEEYLDNTGRDKKDYVIDREIIEEMKAHASNKKRKIEQSPEKILQREKGK